MKIAIKVFLLSLCLLVSGLEARAKFLKTSQNVYQSITNLGVKVIISSEGIFVVQGKPMELQEFDPKRILSKGALHTFIKFDFAKNRYSTLHVGSKQYSIKGNFTLHMGSIRITLDNNNPYCSIVLDDTKTAPKSAPDVLGILGLEAIVNSSGNFAIALLEANKFSEYRRLIKPYYLKKEGLLLKGKPVSTSSIGLSLEQGRSHCLEKGTVLLLESEIKEVQKIRGKKARLKRLNSFLKTNRDKKRYRDLLILRADPKATVGLDYKDGKVYVIRPFRTDTGIIKGSTPKTCVVGTVNL